MSELSLREIFLAKLGREPGRESAGSLAALEEALAGLWERGRAAWPTVDLPPEVFAQYLGRAAPEERELPAFLAGLSAEGVYLACACARGLPQALDAFDRSYLSQLPLLLSGMQPTAAFVDELRQVLREKLFVSKESAPPKIASYTGQGPLLNWLRVVALRTALNLTDSQEERHPRDSAAVASLLAEKDPERDVILRQQRQEFLEVLREAVSALPSQQRAALRLHFAEGKTGEEIAKALSVSRATVVRWLSVARTFLLQETRRLLSRRLNLSPSDAESLIAHARSHLDLSLSVLLRTVG